MSVVNFYNYFNGTYAVFKGCKIPKRKPDFISNSGSKYWQQSNSRGGYVIRLSDHWVNIKIIGNNDIYQDCDKIASCQWHIKTNYVIGRGMIAGKCYLKNFEII